MAGSHPCVDHGARQLVRTVNLSSCGMGAGDIDRRRLLAGSATPRSRRALGLPGSFTCARVGKRISFGRTGRDQCARIFRPCHRWRAILRQAEIQRAVAVADWLASAAQADPAIMPWCQAQPSLSPIRNGASAGCAGGHASVAQIGAARGAGGDAGVMRSQMLARRLRNVQHDRESSNAIQRRSVRLFSRLPGMMKLDWRASAQHRCWFNRALPDA